MNTFEREVRQFILKALLRADGVPLNDDTLRHVVRSAFAHVAITEAELGRMISGLEGSGSITGTNDEVFGLTWTLSPAGKHRALNLR